MQGWDQNLIKIWKYNLMGLPEGWVEKVRTKEFGDKIGLGFGDTRRGVWIWGLGMAGWSDDIASHSLPATLPSTAKTSTRFLSDYQDQEILRNDISSLDNVPHLVQGHNHVIMNHFMTPISVLPRPSSNVLFVSHYLSLSFKPCYFLLRSGTMDY